MAKDDAALLARDDAIYEVGLADSKVKTKVLYFTTKRFFDVLIGIVGTIFTLPIILVVKIIYLVTGDFASVIYRQKRIGKEGKEFTIYKIRTMVPNADEFLAKYLAENKIAAAEYAYYKKLKNDPRITKFGKVLRKLSIDEMPQFFNVLKGDMSVIGNRPYLPREKKDMGRYFEDVVLMRPGITGLWQVSGRSEVTFEQRLDIELEYAKHCGFELDVWIFFRTFKTIFMKEGM